MSRHCAGEALLLGLTITLAAHKVSSQQATGLQACEDHGFTEAECNAIGCCQYDNTLSQCMSNIGSNICGNAAGSGLGDGLFDGDGDNDGDGGGNSSSSGGGGNGSNGGAPGCPDNDWDLHMIDDYGDGWNGIMLTVSDCEGNVLADGLTLGSGFSGTADVCLPPSDGYSISVGGGSYVHTHPIKCFRAICARSLV